MSSLLTLAKELEQKSRAQQHDTGQMLKTAFSEHEAYVRQELNESAKRINGAILDHEQSMSHAIGQTTKGMLWTVGRTWLTILMVSVLLLAFNGSILWWQGKQLIANQEALSQQEDALVKLTARTWGVSYQQDSNGRFLVLPKGMRAETSWTVNDGKQNAVKLLQE